MSKRTVEIWSSGIDEYLQLVGGDPYGGTTAMGLRVPTLATPMSAGGLRSRYLFNGASFSVADGETARIVGARQFVSIGMGGVGSGEGVGPRFVEMEVTSPNWRFPDGNVWMGIRRLGGPNAQNLPAQAPTPAQLRSASYRWSNTPSLLYEAIHVPGASPYYMNLDAYIPPNGGRAWGDPILPGVDFLDLRTQWRTYGAWGSLGLKVEGPETVSFQISVRQTNPGTRAPLHRPTPFFEGGVPPEELFLQNYVEAIYWRVGCSMIVEFE